MKDEIIVVLEASSRQGCQSLAIRVGRKQEDSRFISNAKGARSKNQIDTRHFGINLLSSCFIPTLLAMSDKLVGYQLWKYTMIAKLPELPEYSRGSEI